MLTAEQVAKFQQLYKTRFGKEISQSEAYEQGIKLVRLMELVCQPIAKSNWETKHN